jgi:glycosyltransferase involved in cell wall biosynthesis
VRTVSIILPTFNRIRYLRPAVESVFDQSFADWELICADDGSEQETRDYLRGLASPRVRTVWLDHSGSPSRVRNAAIRVATGRYLAFLDSDDTWAPSKLERQVQALRDRPDWKWSYTRCDRVDGDGRPIVDEALGQRVLPEGWILEPLLKNLRNQMAMASIVADRDLVAEVGGFDEDQRWCEDLDLILRLAMRSQVSVLPLPLCSVRNHEEHYSGDRIAEYDGRIGVYGKIGSLLTDPRLVSLCRRRRAEQSIVLAGLRGDEGGFHAAWRSLAVASGYSCSYPDWWVGALKALARPLAPKPIRNAYRQWRRAKGRLGLDRP